MAAGLEAPLGTLYVVGTPIGNLDDMSLRALRVLREVSLVAAEDTRRTRALLTHYGLATPLVSYREQNRAAATPLVLGRLATASVALVSDAGMPAISDPGSELIARVSALGGRVEVVPGPSALLMALVASGLPTTPFTFVGFLSRQRGARRRQLDDLATRPETLVLYEAPHRLRETLSDLRALLGDRPAAVCRELTKLHEEVLRAPLSALVDHFHSVEPRGEFTLVVSGCGPQAARRPGLTDDEVDARLSAALHGGEDMRAVVADLARATGRPRREIYARWQELRRTMESGNI
jgi:16S rRNA (cytidine1402-2'-O)-methyltransferase